jgi:hypothetical protein
LLRWSTPQRSQSPNIFPSHSTAKRGARLNEETSRPSSRLGSHRTSQYNSSKFDVSTVLKNIKTRSPMPMSPMPMQERDSPQEFKTNSYKVERLSWQRSDPPIHPASDAKTGQHADNDTISNQASKCFGRPLSPNGIASFSLGHAVLNDQRHGNWEIRAERASANSEMPLQQSRSEFVEGTKSSIRFPRASTFYTTTTSNSRPSSTILPLKKHTSPHSSFRTSLTGSQSFLQSPGPLDEFVRCRIERLKSGFLSGPTRYTMTFESYPSDMPNTCGVVTAVRYSRPYAPAKFNIYLTDANDLSGHQELVAELHASFLGTEYRLFGFQNHWKKNSNSERVSSEGEGEESAALNYPSLAWHGKKVPTKGIDGGKVKHELCSVTYAQNILGTQGPRRALVLLSKLVPGKPSAWDVQPFVDEINMALDNKESSLFNRCGIRFFVVLCIIRCSANLIYPASLM